MGGLTRSKAVIDFIERHLRVPDGKFVGEPIRLRPWQKRLIRNIYDTPTRTAIISWARKNAKTTLAAMLVLAHLCGPEVVRNSELASTALKKDQAAILFRLAAKMVRLSPTLSGHIGIRDTAKQMFCPHYGTTYSALSSDARTEHGASIAMAVHDELGQVRGPRSELFDTVETACGAHESPLSIVISTQAPTDADLLSILIDDALKGQDPETKVFLWSAPQDLDPFSVKAMRKANPAYGDFLNEDEIKRYAQKAKRMPSFEASYRNLHLNQRVNQESPFVPQNVWNACAKAPEDEAFTGKVRMALDLSARNDLTALVYTAEYNDETHARCEFFAPLDGIYERSQRDRVPYDVWAKQGFLTATPGASVDYDYVAERLIQLCDEMDVESIAFDRWRIDVLKAALDRAGVELPLVPHGQGFRDMAPALDMLEGVLMNGQLRHGGHPILTMCAANAVVDTDPAGNRKLNKAKSTGRIDGMVALAMCMKESEIEKSGYWPSGVVSL